MGYSKTQRHVRKAIQEAKHSSACTPFLQEELDKYELLQHQHQNLGKENKRIKTLTKTSGPKQVKNACKRTPTRQSHAKATPRYGEKNVLAHCEREHCQFQCSTRSNLPGCRCIFANLLLSRLLHSHRLSSNPNVAYLWCPGQPRDLRLPLVAQELVWIFRGWPSVLKTYSSSEITFGLLKVRYMYFMTSAKKKLQNRDE